MKREQILTPRSESISHHSPAYAVFNHDELISEIPYKEHQRLFEHLYTAAILFAPQSHTNTQFDFHLKQYLKSVGTRIDPFADGFLVERKILFMVDPPDLDAAALRVREMLRSNPIVLIAYLVKFHDDGYPRWKRVEISSRWRLPNPNLESPPKPKMRKKLCSKLNR